MKLETRSRRHGYKRLCDGGTRRKIPILDDRRQPCHMLAPLIGPGSAAVASEKHSSALSSLCSDFVSVVL